MIPEMKVTKARLIVSRIVKCYFNFLFNSWKIKVLTKNLKNFEFKRFLSLNIYK